VFEFGVADITRPSAQEVVKDLKFLFVSDISYLASSVERFSVPSSFQVSNFFFSCINTSFFFSTFHDPIKRQDMQPSLVLAALSMATFMRSSELGLGHAGRTRARTRIFVLSLAFYR
jgi:hypothetical protein